VRPGGIIIWHDYGNPTVEVTQVLDHLYDLKCIGCFNSSNARVLS
jgi:hypothetical protein